MQRVANLVDLEKRCKMTIYLQRSVSIQPKTSDFLFSRASDERSLPAALAAAAAALEAAEDGVRDAGRWGLPGPFALLLGENNGEIMAKFRSFSGVSATFLFLFVVSLRESMEPYR